MKVIIPLGDDNYIFRKKSTSTFDRKADEPTMEKIIIPNIGSFGWSGKDKMN